MTDEHLSADTLADLQEGLLDADGEATARRHLESCGTCRDDLAVLSDVPALLAAAGDVGPVPELVAHRLDRALAEAAAEPVPPKASPAASTVTPLDPGRRAPRGMTLLQVAAATVLVLGLGALGFSALRSIDTGGSAGSAGTSANDSAAGAPERAAVAPVTASGRDWTGATLRRAAPQLATGSLGPVVSTYSTRRDAAGGGSSGGGSGADSPSPATPSASAKALVNGPAAALTDPANLAACVTNLTGGAEQPLAVDLATYETKPAAVFVFPATGDPGRLDVYVVAPDCPPGGLLYYASVPRS